LGHITDISRPGRAALLATVLAATLALGGCGGIEFQGKVFDYMGLSGDRKEADVHMAERPPLLLPPDPKALPQPGNGVAAATARDDWPKNPEVVQTEIVKANDDAKAEERAAIDPVNPLKGKNNPLIEKWLSKKKKVEQPDDTPEPDPSDKPPEGQSQGVAQAAPKPLTPPMPQEDVPNEDLFHPAPPDSYKNPGALY
jgi:hypothetical protein